MIFKAFLHKYYEIILENVPCKLYFDIDVDLKSNQNDVDYDRMVDMLIRFVNNDVKVTFDITSEKLDVLGKS